MRGLDYDPEQDEKPDGICVSNKDWEQLGADARLFLVEAEKAGLCYIATVGTVLAWGPCPNVFSMETDKEPNEYDGWLITPRSQRAIMYGRCFCGGEGGKVGPVHHRHSSLEWQGGSGEWAEYKCPYCDEYWVPEDQS